MAEASLRKNGGVRIIIKQFTVGVLYTNCYLVSCSKTRNALVIDAGFDKKTEGEKITEEINRHKLHVKYIVNTHGHPDHISGNRAMREATGAPVLIHEADAPLLKEPGKNMFTPWGFIIDSPPADKLLHDGNTVQTGEIRLKVLHTPGHSQGSICLLSEDDDVVFTGDTLFAGSIGRTDLPGSSPEAMTCSLKDKLVSLPDRLNVYPGHGPASTMETEKRSNPFLQF